MRTTGSTRPISTAQSPQRRNHPSASSRWWARMPTHLPGPRSSGSPNRAARPKAASDPTRLPTAPARMAISRFMWPVAASSPAVGMMTSLGKGKPQLSKAIRISTPASPQDATRLERVVVKP